MTGASIRALTRVARRDITRHRGRSALVLALIVLPVAGMVAAIAILRTTEPTQDRNDAALMGRADLIAQGLSEAELWTYLPEGSTVEPIAFSSGSIVLPGAKPSVTLRGLVLDGLGKGMLTLVDGRPPTGTAEVAITGAVARLAGVRLGDQLTLDGTGPATVVGIVENELDLRDRIVVLDPAAITLGSEEFATWLVGLPESADPQAIVESTLDPATGTPIVNIHSRTTGRLGVMGGDSSSMILVLGSLALVEAALIASAAFAVSIRRRQRELGLLAATGATPRQLAGTVVAEAAILGLVACVLGIAVGLVGAFALTPFLDELTQRRNPPLVLDAAGFVGPAVIGFVAAMIAAIVPARTAAHVPVMLSLSGRRPPSTPARRGLRIGLAAVALSVGMTLLGATLGMNGGETVSTILMVGGAVLGTLGFGACGPWLLERLETVAVRLPLAGRIAFRDTARARSRSSPIVTAVLASFAATVALGTWTVSRDAANAAEWQPYLYPNQLVIRGSGSQAAGEEFAKTQGVVATAAIEKLSMAEPAYFWIEVPGAGRFVNVPSEGRRFFPLQIQDAAVATPEILVVTRAQAAAPAIAAGKVVILSEEPLTADFVEFMIQEHPEGIEPERRVRIDAEIVVTDLTSGVLTEALVPASVAESLELEPWPEVDYVVEFDRPVTEADVEAAAAVAAQYADTFADASIGPQPPDQLFRLVMIALALLFAVSVTGIAIALGEAESRPEQRSLLALGADPRLRRHIAAARAAVLGLLAGLLAVPAGLLPVWGLLVSQDAAFVIPWLEVAGAVAALPLLAVISAWLLSRPIPDWAAFRSIGAGK